jgi:peptide/nickel transport system substrate-binding protein
LIALLVAVIGCTGTAAESPSGDESDEPAGASQGPVQGGSLVVALEAETSGWSPWEDALAASGMTVARSFYETLLERDHDGVLRPNLAASFEANDDHTEFVLTVREGITFHDGEPLDAEAVVANLSIFLRPGTTSAGPIDTVEVVDEQTVRIGLERPHVAFGDMLAGQAGFMVSPAALETTRTEPVGTGPFVFDSWLRDQQLVVRRNEDYWREDLPYLDEIVFRPIPDEESRLLSLQSGDVDVLQSLLPASVARVREQGGGIVGYEHVGSEAGATIYNVTRPPLDDVRIRQAVAHGLDGEAITEALGGTGVSTPARGVFHPDSPWFDEVAAEGWPRHDPDAARALVGEYVADPERSDGRPVGSAPGFTVDLPPDPALTETASVYQDLLGRVGLEVDIRTVEQAVHIQQAIGMPPDFNGDFDAKFWRLGSDADPNWMAAWFHPGSPLNFTNFEHDELVAVLAEAQQTVDEDERRALYRRATEIFAEHVPFTVGSHTVSVVAASEDVHGIDDWRLPDGERGIGHPGAQARWHEVWRDPGA